MLLDAASLTSLQSCPRRYLLERHWRAAKWQPKSLLYHCLRGAMEHLCRGGDAKAAADLARTRLLELAADPGMDTAPGVNPYALALDFCAMIDTIVRSEWRSLQPEPPQLVEAEAVALCERHQWRVSARQDSASATRALHRWVFWDSYSDAKLSAELHSWAVFGEVALAGVPMQLHIISVGRMVDGRMESPWAACVKHPKFPNVLRFGRRGTAKGKSFTNTFQRMRLSDMPQQSPDEWVDAMWRDGVAQQLRRSVQVQVPPPEACGDALRQVLAEADRMQAMAKMQYAEPPMSRAACDGGWTPCPFQVLCHRAEPVAAGLVGAEGFRRRENGER